MERAVDALQELSILLGREYLTWQDIDDPLLERFRDQAFVNVRGKKQNKNERTAKNTVNEKLEVIYKFLFWAQEIEQLAENLIGVHEYCRVLSHLVQPEGTSRSSPLRARDLYPKKFRGVGSSSRTGDTKHWGTDSDLRKIEAFFSEHYPSHLAVRNILMLRLFELGWRGGSVACLKCAQFSMERQDEAELAGEEKFPLVPKTQKIGYEDTYFVPFALAGSILSYINSSRKLLVQKGVPTSDALFLSEKTGKRLEETSISSIFTDAFHAIGVHIKDAGARSLRRRFAERRLRSELEYRQKHSLSTAMDDVLLAVSPDMHHRSQVSIESYVRAHRYLREHDGEEQRNAEMDHLKAENLALKARNAVLEEVHAANTSLFRAFKQRRQFKPKPRPKR
jgi:hypothetical protein